MACSSFINKEKSCSFFLCGITEANKTPAIVAWIPDSCVKNHRNNPRIKYGVNFLTENLFKINKNINVKNKDIVNDKELKLLIKSIESDITVGRVLVRPSGTESKIRIMIEAQEERVAEKFSDDILKIIKSKS